MTGSAAFDGASTPMVHPLHVRTDRRNSPRRRHEPASDPEPGDYSLCSCFIHGPRCYRDAGARAWDRNVGHGGSSERLYQPGQTGQCCRNMQQLISDAGRVKSRQNWKPQLHRNHNKGCRWHAGRAIDTPVERNAGPALPTYGAALITSPPNCRYIVPNRRAVSLRTRKNKAARRGSYGSSIRRC